MTGGMDEICDADDKKHGAKDKDERGGGVIFLDVRISVGKKKMKPDAPNREFPITMICPRTIRVSITIMPHLRLKRRATGKIARGTSPAEPRGSTRRPARRSRRTHGPCRPRLPCAGPRRTCRRSAIPQLDIRGDGSLRIVHLRSIIIHIHARFPTELIGTAPSQRASERRRAS